MGDDLGGARPPAGRPRRAGRLGRSPQHGRHAGRRPHRRGHRADEPAAHRRRAGPARRDGGMRAARCGVRGRRRRAGRRGGRVRPGARPAGRQRVARGRRCPRPRAAAERPTRWCCSPAAPPACPSRSRSATTSIMARLSAYRAAVRRRPARQRGVDVRAVVPRRRDARSAAEPLLGRHDGDPTPVRRRAAGWSSWPRHRVAVGVPRADHAGPHPRPPRPGDDRRQLAARRRLRRGGRTRRPGPSGHAAVAHGGLRQRVRPDRDPRRLHDALARRPPRPGPRRVGRATAARRRGPRRRPRDGRRRRAPARWASSGCSRPRTSGRAGSRRATWPARTPTATCTRPAGGPI